MERKYKSLTEQTTRMKSLFTEERLYGNLVDNNEKPLTEQRRFFSNVADAFRVSLKSFDDLDSFTRFINREISNVQDMIKHVDDFPRIWKLIHPNLNLQLLKRNLVQLEKAVANGKLKSIPKESVLDVLLPAFPERGGMRDMVYDLWLEANGKSRLLPSTKETRIVKRDPTTKEIIVGVEGKNGVVYKNKNGEVVVIDDPKKIEYTDFEDVTPGTALDELSGHKVPFTPKNFEEVMDAMAKKIDETIEQKGFVTAEDIIKQSDATAKQQQDMFDKVFEAMGGKKQESKEGFIDDAIEAPNPDGTPPTAKEKSARRKYWEKKLGPVVWHTRWVWNPLHVGEKGLAKKLNREVAWIKDPNSLWNAKGLHILLRTTLFTPLTVGSVYTTIDPIWAFYDPEDTSNNLIENTYKAMWENSKGFLGWLFSFGKTIAQDGLEYVIKEAFGIDLQSTRVNGLKKANDQFLYVGTEVKNPDGTFKSTLTCKTILDTPSDKELARKILIQQLDLEHEELKKREKQLFLELSQSTADYQRYQGQFKKWKNEEVDKALANSDMMGLVDKARTQCENLRQNKEESSGYDEKEYEVDFEGTNF